MEASDQKEPFRGWIASLSNGETIFEGMSSWQDLIIRCANEGLYLTQIRLQLGGLTFIGISDSNGYCQFTDVFRSLYTGKESRSRGIGSVINDKVYVVIIDEYGNIKQEIRELESMKLHCIMR